MQDRLLSLQPGSVLNDRYEIIKVLGMGSTGMVYVCRNRDAAESETLSDSAVTHSPLLALKVLHSNLTDNPNITARFFNEIEALCSVTHENVVRIADYFRDGDFIAYTMEYVDGTDLSELVAGGNLLPISDVLRFLAQICGGTAAIHRAGIIHRDLKPENCLVSSDGTIKIFDFGIARAEKGRALTEPGSLVGTVDYLSPEYLTQNQLDHRSDIYAIGLMGYVMLTGQMPWHDQRIIDSLISRVHSDPVPVESVRLDCPDKLGEIIRKAMCRDPEKRYQSASLMLRDLKEFSTAYIYLDEVAAAE